MLCPCPHWRSKAEWLNQGGTRRAQNISLPFCERANLSILSQAPLEKARRVFESRPNNKCAPPSSPGKSELHSQDIVEDWFPNYCRRCIDSSSHLHRAIVALNPM